MFDDVKRFDDQFVKTSIYISDLMMAQGDITNPTDQKFCHGNEWLKYDRRAYVKMKFTSSL